MIKEENRMCRKGLHALASGIIGCWPCKLAHGRKIYQLNREVIIARVSAYQRAHRAEKKKYDHSRWLRRKRNEKATR